MLVLIFYIVKYTYYIVDFSIFILINCTKSNTIIIGRGIIVHNLPNSFKSMVTFEIGDNRELFILC